MKLKEGKSIVTLLFQLIHQIFKEQADILMNEKLIL